MLQIPECFYRVSVKALISDETGKKYLLFKEQDDKRDFPGGGLDFGEEIRLALKRELLEEAGLEVLDTPVKLCYAIPWKWKGEIYALHLFYEVKIKDLNFIPSEECKEIGFFTPGEMLSLNGSKVFSYFVKQRNENH